MKMSSSIACIIYDGKKILVAHRNPTGDMGGRWEFPGGKLDEGESFEEAIVREMKEEFGVKASVHQKICTSSFLHRGTECSLDAFMVSLEHDGIKKPYTLTEHTEYKWVLPEDIRKMNFVDSDLKIYPYVLDFINGTTK